MGSKRNNFRGVRQRHWGSWVSEIRHPFTKRRVWLGTFPSAKDAAIAYDEASRFLCGPTANTNFPLHDYHHECGNDDNVLVARNFRSRLSPALKEKLRKCSLEYEQRYLFSASNTSLHPQPLITKATNIFCTNYKNQIPKGGSSPQLSCNLNGKYAIFESWQGLRNNNSESGNVANITQYNGHIAQYCNGWANVVASSCSHSHNVEEEIPKYSLGSCNQEKLLINVGDDDISHSSNSKDTVNSIVTNEEGNSSNEDWISQEMITELLNTCLSPELDIFLI